MRLTKVSLPADFDCLSKISSADLRQVLSDASLLAECENLAQAWRDHLCVLRYESKEENKGLLCIFLDETVETEVEDAWNESPFHGYMLHLLAQEICMSAVRSQICQVAEKSCSPLPELDEEQSKILLDAGILAKSGKMPALKRKYATLTWFPYKGGCEVCLLTGNCPRTGKN